VKPLLKYFKLRSGEKYTMKEANTKLILFISGEGKNSIELMNKPNILHQYWTKRIAKGLLIFIHFSWDKEKVNELTGNIKK